jgi:hypothetical protein
VSIETLTLFHLDLSRIEVKASSSQTSCVWGLLPILDEIRVAFRFGVHCTSPTSAVYRPHCMNLGSMQVSPSCQLQTSALNKIHTHHEILIFVSLNDLIFYGYLKSLRNFFMIFVETHTSISISNFLILVSRQSHHHHHHHSEVGQSTFRTFRSQQISNPRWFLFC